MDKAIAHCYKCDDYVSHEIVEAKDTQSFCFYNCRTRCTRCGMLGWKLFLVKEANNDPKTSEHIRNEKKVLLAQEQKKQILVGEDGGIQVSVLQGGIKGSRIMEVH